jgi:hypothetical protein
MHFKICGACDCNYAVAAEEDSCPQCRSGEMERKLKTLKLVEPTLPPPEEIPPLRLTTRPPWLPPAA